MQDDLNFKVKSKLAILKKEEGMRRVSVEHGQEGGEDGKLH